MPIEVYSPKGNEEKFCEFIGAVKFNVKLDRIANGKHFSDNEFL